MYPTSQQQKTQRKDSHTFNACNLLLLRSPICWAMGESKITTLCKIVNDKKCNIAATVHVDSH